MNIQDELRNLRALKERYRALNKEYQKAKAEHDALEMMLFDKMRELGLMSMRTTEGVYAAKSTAYAQVNDHEAFQDWCRENGLDTEFLKQKEIPQRLNEYVRHALDTGQDLPPGVTWYPKDYISISTS
jgi:hypothetical protein